MYTTFSFPHKRNCTGKQGVDTEISVLVCKEVIQAQNIYIDMSGYASVDENSFEEDEVVKRWLECPKCRVKVEDTSNVEEV